LILGNSKSNHLGAQGTFNPNSRFPLQVVDVVIKELPEFYCKDTPDGTLPEGAAAVALPDSERVRIFVKFAKQAVAMKVYMYLCIYLHIYIHRERDRQRERDGYSYPTASACAFL